MAKGPAQPNAPNPPTGEQPADALGGLRAWVAQLDRKLGVRFYALGAAVVLALAASIVALVLVLQLQDDTATRSDVEGLKEEVADVQRSASQAADEDIAALSERVDSLESQLQSLRSGDADSEQRLSVAEDDIADLRDQINQLESQSNGK